MNIHSIYLPTNQITTTYVHKFEFHHFVQEIAIPTFTEPSLEAVITRPPSLVKIASLTYEVWPRNSFNIFPDFNPCNLPRWNYVSRILRICRSDIRHPRFENDVMKVAHCDRLAEQDPQLPAHERKAVTWQASPLIKFTVEYCHHMITVLCHRRMYLELGYYPLKRRRLLLPDHVLAQTSANIVQFVFSTPAKKLSYFHQNVKNLLLSFSAVPTNKNARKMKLDAQIPEQ